ncbi:MAG: methyltransferase domain-containing protein [Ginsengibacter sp.]
MIDYGSRSYKKELLDRDDIPFDDIRQNMKELNFINTYLGGHSITIAGFKKLLGTKKALSICEIGCGGGDNLNAIYNWAKRNKVEVNFTGIDIKANCISYARKKSQIKNINFIVNDYKLIEFGNNKPDIIFSSLFCHHFTDAELIKMMIWMKANCALGFFINDLHRHPVAYHFIKFASRLFSSSYLVKNDAPLSVLRGFKKQDWENILQQAGITDYTIKWMWEFRYLVKSSLSAKVEFR